MAGDWIKFEIATPNKPEVWAIAGALEVDPDAVVGKLLRVWAWFDEHTENGNAPSVSKTLLDRQVGVTGFCDAMISAGWMTENSGTITLPNFDRHNGKTAKNRALTAKRVSAHKARITNAPVTPKPLPREEKEKTNKSYTDDFLSAWAEYPPRAGGNSKSDAFKAWNARLREGHKPGDMIAGVKRYRAFCDAAERTGTAFVKQAASFFGPSDPPHFLEPWQVPAPTQKQTAGNRTQLPRSDGDLGPWAQANGFGSPRPGETYQQYRVRLQREVEQREREAA